MVDNTNHPKLMVSRSIIAKKEMKPLSDVSQNFIGVWLDENSDRTDNEIYINFKQALEDTFDYLQPYKKIMDCITYLNGSESGKILFIVSHKHASNIMAIIEEVLSKIHSMYIICSNESEKDSWKSKNVEKLRGSYVCIGDLMQHLKDDVKIINASYETPETSSASSSTQDTTDERITNAMPPISVFSTKPINNMIKHLNKDSIWFVRYQLLIDIILKLEKSATAFVDMIYVCNKLCIGDKIRLKEIEEFAKNPKDAFDPIYWYTKDSFIGHLLNKICGSQIVDEIYQFRLYIRNLHDELVELDKIRRENPKKKTTVFRGKYLAQSTFEKLKNNKNGLIAMNGFLSTTRDEIVAKLFVNEGAILEDKMAVLFKLTIDPEVSNRPYADIPFNRHAKKKSEQELLFSIGTVWRVVDIYELKDDKNPPAKMWCVELASSNEDDEQTKALAEYLKKEIGEKSTIWTLGDFLTKVGQYKQAEDYYRLLEQVLPEEDISRATIYNRIAYARYEGKDSNAALDCLKIAMKHAREDSEIAAVTEYNTQTILAEASVVIMHAPYLRRRFDDYNVVLKYLSPDPASISIIKNNFGHICHQQGDFDRALKYYEDALETLLKSKSGLLPEISAVYNNIGGVRYSQERYEIAAENFYLAMTTLSTLDSSHPWIQEYTENYQAARRHTDINKSKRLKPE